MVTQYLGGDNMFKSYSTKMVRKTSVCASMLLLILTLSACALGANSSTQSSTHSPEMQSFMDAMGSDFTSTPARRDRGSDTPTENVQDNSYSSTASDVITNAGYTNPYPTPIEEQPARHMLGSSTATPAPVQTSADDAFYFRFNDGIIYPGQNINDAIRSIGGPIARGQIFSEEYNGYTRVFAYGAINIHTIPVNGQDIIQSISLRNDTITTTFGIRLGAHWDIVPGIYGHNYSSVGNTNMFVQGNTTLSFYLSDDGFIFGIEYMYNS